MRVARHFGLINLPPNFAPIAAIALFAGARIKNRAAAIFIPLFAMLAADAFIGFYDFRIFGSVYISFALSGLIGRAIRKRVTPFRIIGASLFSSTIFFLITNAAVWFFSGMYSKTISGLMESYAMGVPFWRFTILGDLFYTVFIFGTHYLVNLWTQQLFTKKRASALIRKS